MFHFAALVIPVIAAGMISNQAAVIVSFIGLLIPVVFIGLFQLSLVFIYVYVPILISRKYGMPDDIPGEQIKEDITETDTFDKVLAGSGFAYDPGQDLFYSLMNPWQRKFGYCRLYDEATVSFSMIIDCEPIRFEYDNRRWMIEFWKGQYGMTTGGEIGVFNTAEEDMEFPELFTGTFYNSVSDSELLDMSYTLRKNGAPLFKRKARHWWLTGFLLGEFSESAELSMDIQITLKDKAMCAAFVQGLKNAGYTPGEYAVINTTVQLEFGKAHTPQPVSRTRAAEWIMQRKNEYLCKEYRSITKDYGSMPQKLQVVQKRSPGMYRHILNMGKSRQVFSAYDRIHENTHAATK